MRVIELKDIWKKYKISSGDFWALKNVSFALEQGDFVGIIGENGAGKSTILKLLAKVTCQDKGSLKLIGSISPLIEVSAGFHPDLTGRENVYLNGVLMGLSKKEIDRRFNEIIGFSELWDFIDTPVKKYSSGMLVRLGFALVVNTSADIILVDEILSVGDEKFRSKCQSKIDDLRKKKITFLYVSHDLVSVKRLCHRAIWLQNGEVVMDDNVTTVINRYLDKTRKDSAKDLVKSNSIKNRKIHRWGSGEIKINEVVFYNAKGTKKYMFKTGDDIIVKIKCYASKEIKNPVFGAVVHSSNGIYLAGINSLVHKKINSVKGDFYITYHFQNISLSPGRYFMSLGIHNEPGNYIYDYHNQSYEFEIYESLKKVLPIYSGYLLLKCKWQHKPQGIR